MELDLKALQFAVVLAKYRHFGRAAAALQVSQPTLSRNIASLEKQLGTPIFERSRKDIAMTSTGADVLKMAEELVGRSEAIANRLEMVRAGKGGHMRIAASPQIADLAIYPALIDLLNSNPPMSIEVLERDWTGALDMLENDQADFGVMDAIALPKALGLRIDPAGAFENCLVCRSGHPLLARKSVQPVDLARYRVLRLRRPVDWRIDGVQAVEASNGAAHSSISLSSCRGMFEVVARTDSLMFAHASQVKEFVAAGRLAVLPAPAAEGKPVQVGFVYKRSRTPLSSARTFMSLIRKRLPQAGP